MADRPLDGAGVLVTRPQRQADALVDAIESRGGIAIRFPVIEARPHARADVVAAAGALQRPDIVILVSVNAVRFGLRYAGDAAIGVVGPATAHEIEQSGRNVDIRSPGGFTSEQLLAAPELQDVTGKIVRIIRGNGGRELLATTLRDRGAIVEYLEVYERVVPDHEPSEVTALGERWRDGGIEAVTIMSVETLRNLVELLPAEHLEYLGKTRLVTPASRVIKAASDRFPGIPTTLAKGPQAADMVEAIVTSMQSGHSDD
ncbi:MAG: uroporphyrinogen-III synthase [Woeseiaceae bacterium]|nr:uroporphyrinogen-III synthase [Woeseiaceae bacterium]